MKTVPRESQQKNKTSSRRKILIGTLALLVATNVATVSILVYQNRPDAILSFENPYPLIDPARSFIGQEHYLATLQPLRVELYEMVAREKKEGNEIAIYFEYLNTGANIAVNPELRIFPASLIKLPLAFTVLKKIEGGDWRLNDKLVLAPGDQSSGFGQLYRKPVGTMFTIEELLKALLEDSDNTAYQILLRNLSPDEVDATFEALGLGELFNSVGQITAKEYSRLFRALYTASYLNREHSQILLKWLDEAPFEGFLSTGLPREISFSHKFGTHGPQRVYTDSGIAYVSNRPYLITVLIHRTKGDQSGDQEEAERIMQEISESAYTYISTQ
jgi:beta-lactamase class A